MNLLKVRVNERRGRVSEDSAVRRSLDIGLDRLFLSSHGGGK